MYSVHVGMEKLAVSLSHLVVLLSMATYMYCTGIDRVKCASHGDIWHCKLVLFQNTFHQCNLVTLSHHGGEGTEVRVTSAMTCVEQLTNFIDWTHDGASPFVFSVLDGCVS